MNLNFLLIRSIYSYEKCSNISERNVIDNLGITVGTPINARNPYKNEIINIKYIAFKILPNCEFNYIFNSRFP